MVGFSHKKTMAVNNSIFMEDQSECKNPSIALRANECVFIYTTSVCKPLVHRLKKGTDPKQICSKNGNANQQNVLNTTLNNNEPI